MHVFVKGGSRTQSQSLALNVNVNMHQVHHYVTSSLEAMSECFEYQYVVERNMYPVPTILNQSLLVPSANACYKQYPRFY